MGERKLVQPVRQGRPGNGDTQLVAYREVRQAQAAWRMFLGKEDLALDPMLGAPLAHPAL